jgi:hypothetical protein
LKAPEYERLKLKFDKLLSIFAFNFYLRRFNEDEDGMYRQGVTNGGGGAGGGAGGGESRKLWFSGGMAPDSIRITSGVTSSDTALDGGGGPSGDRRNASVAPVRFTPAAEMTPTVRALSLGGGVVGAPGANPPGTASKAEGVIGRG